MRSTYIYIWNTYTMKGGLYTMKDGFYLSWDNCIFIYHYTWKYSASVEVCLLK